MYQVIATIDGMSCGMCEAHVNDAIRKAFPDAKKVTSSASKKEARFQTELPLNRDLLRRAIDELGYEFIDADTYNMENQKGGLLSFFHRS